MSLLEIENLSLAIDGRPVLDRVDLTLDAGEVLGLVGESGSGKSMTALAAMRLLPRGAIASGALRFDGTDLLQIDEQAMCGLRGRAIGMVFQEPMTALNPLKTIGEQVAEGIRWHTGGSRAEAEDRARRMLDRVGLPEARFPLSRFPHQLSGGQRQRVVIAIACALAPKLLIADEPTTALDVVLQAQILDLLRGMVAESRMAMLLISHDLAVVTDMADRIAIMRAGAILETGETARVLSEPRHPYTRELALASTHVPERRSLPWESGSQPGDAGSVSIGDFREPSSPPPSRLRLDTSPPLSEVEDKPSASATPIRHPATRGGGTERSEAEGGTPHDKQPRQPEQPLLAVTSLTRDYLGPRHALLRKSLPFRAVDDVSFAMEAGRSTALVGRSGCGKSTLARLILALDRPDSGEIRFEGKPIVGKSQAELRPVRRDMQVVFQDPYGSFDSRQTVERLVAEPLHLLDRAPSRDDRRERVAAALREVGLEADDMRRYPHEFSGGQRQRLSIARAIITRPKLVVADEAVSALDVSIRARILDLIAALNARLGVTYLFITHDLHVARAITDDVLVMHDGRIVERGKTAEILDDPQSDAAKALVAATPNLAKSIARKLKERE